VLLLVLTNGNKVSLVRGRALGARRGGGVEEIVGPCLLTHAVE